MHWFEGIAPDINSVTAFAAIITTGAALLLLWETYLSHRRQERAYLGVENIALNLPGLDNPSYQPVPQEAGRVFDDFVLLTVKNYGNTPASNVITRVNWQTVDFGTMLDKTFSYPDYESITNPNIGRVISKFSLLQQQLRESKHPVPNVDLFGQARQKKKNLYLYGHVDYRDIYGRKWRRNFSYIWEPWQTVGSQFVPDQAHNDEIHTRRGLLTKLRSALTTLRYLLEAVKVEQSLFALPFAYLGMVLAARGLPTLSDFLWVTLAMVGARNAGMAFNRVLDRRLDALNPRTARRHLPRGLLRPWELTALGVGGLALLFLAAWQLNPLALALSPLAALAVVGYSLVKRFSWLTHFALGLTLAIAPAGGWIAVTGALSWEAILLVFIVATFAGGFDIFNTVSDVEFDRGHGIHSLPKRFGLPAAFWVARAMHLGTSAGLLALGLWLGLAWPYFVGWAIASALLVYEHWVLSRDLTRLASLFSWVNATVSVVVLAFALVAIMVGG